MERGHVWPWAQRKLGEGCRDSGGSLWLEMLLTGTFRLSSCPLLLVGRWEGSSDTGAIREVLLAEVGFKGKHGKRVF